MLLGELLGSVVDLFKLPFSIGSVTFSYWQVFLFAAFGGVIAWCIWEIFN